MTSTVANSKRDAANEVIKGMDGVWCELGELAAKARYNRGFCLTRFEMTAFLKEQKQLGVLEHKTVKKTIDCKQRFFSFWRKKKEKAAK